MKALVDEDLCIGCGACEDTCPEVFELGDDGLAHVVHANAGPELYECIRSAIDGCPVDAIAIAE